MSETSHETDAVLEEGKARANAVCRGALMAATNGYHPNSAEEFGAVMTALTIGHVLAVGYVIEQTAMIAHDPVDATRRCFEGARDAVNAMLDSMLEEGLARVAARRMASAEPASAAVN